MVEVKMRNKKATSEEVAGQLSGLVAFLPFAIERCSTAIRHLPHLADIARAQFLILISAPVYLLHDLILFVACAKRGYPDTVRADYRSFCHVFLSVIGVFKPLLDLLQRVVVLLGKNGFGKNDLTFIVKAVNNWLEVKVNLVKRAVVAVLICNHGVSHFHSIELCHQFR
jgi:hypothetical protein